MMFLWFLFLIPLVFFLTARTGEGAGYWGPASHPAHAQGDAPIEEAPIEIARKRLARGEITPMQFEEIRRAIDA